MEKDDGGDGSTSRALLRLDRASNGTNSHSTMTASSEDINMNRGGAPWTVQLLASQLGLKDSHTRVPFPSSSSSFLPSLEKKIQIYVYVILL